MFHAKTLEFDSVLEIVSKYAQIEYTKDKILNIKPITDLGACQTLLQETEEARKHIIKFGDIPLGGIYSNLDALNKAKIGSVLNPLELQNISLFIMGIKNIQNYYKVLTNQNIFISYLEKYLNFGDFKKLKTEIDLCIDDKCSITDSASNELQIIRKSIKQSENRLNSKLTEMLSTHSKILQEAVIVRRNDRLCLPVKVEFKNTFKGIIHDESASGTTFFIEPASCVEINNQLQTLQNKEKIEIEKILHKLSLLVSLDAIELINNFYLVSKLDLIYAKARYAINTNCFIPSLNEDGIIDLINARHPLIDSAKVVPLNISLGDKYQTIIITGPNTGGKTVSLKTVGLLTIMAQSGLLVPCDENSKIAVFDNVFVDIGDEQSIEQSLSTFSSHMTKIINIINSLTINSLVLLDELGSGTDPKEGTSLAIAILNYLRKRGSRTMITTHYSELKAYAFNEQDIINASVEFDLESLIPTYRLLLGVPGKSNALEIVKRLGMNKEIIDNAKNNTELIKDDIQETINKLESEANFYNNKKQEYDTLIKEMKIKESKIDLEIEQINKEKRRLIDEATKKANEVYTEANLKIELLIEEIEKLRKKQDIKEHEIAEIKHKTKILASERILEPHIDQDIRVHDVVYVIPYNTQGTVIKINKDKYDVRIGNINASFKKIDLNYLKTPKEIKPKQTHVGTTIKREGKMELDLRGYRYEDAVIEIDKFIDRALLARFNMVYIIHGFGTGAIRKAVWEYLKKCKHIESYRYGGEGEGLNGVTVAYFK